MRTLPLLFTVAVLTAAEPAVLNRDGAWCWFQDERVLVDGRQLYVTSISSKGEVQVNTWSLATGAVRAFTLVDHFQVDDHNVPALLLRADGHVMAFWTTHSGQASAPKMFVRVTTKPHDTTAWDPIQTLDFGSPHGFSYANPFQLPAEAGRIYFFWRSFNYNPTWSSSDDNGRTWRKAANHIFYKNGERPYVKYASNGRDTIHFAYTDGHPNRPGFQNSLYHAYLRGGVLYRSDGTAVRRLEDGPIQVAEGTRVYDGRNSPTGEAWVWDLHLDPKGQPVIAYTSHVSPSDIRYRDARWNGSAWEDGEIARAGRRLYPTQEYYAGGITLDPDSLDTVYLSASVHPVTGVENASGHYELWKGRRAGGKWAFQNLTPGAKVDNLRPIVPAGHPKARNSQGAFVLWYRGEYRTYTDWSTEVVALR